MQALAFPRKPDTNAKPDIYSLVCKQTLLETRLLLLKYA